MEEAGWATQEETTKVRRELRAVVHELGERVEGLEKELVGVRALMQH